MTSDEQSEKPAFETSSVPVEGWKPYKLPELTSNGLPFSSTFILPNGGSSLDSSLLPTEISLPFGFHYQRQHAISNRPVIDLTRGYFDPFTLCLFMSLPQNCTGSRTLFHPRLPGHGGKRTRMPAASSSTKRTERMFGTLTVIPMREEVIFRLLAGEMKEAEITPEHILSYEPGHEYTCYVASIAIRAEHRQHFGRLLHGFLDFWYEQYPEVQITKLYGFALGREDSDGMRLIRKLYFAPRYDIGDGETIYELRLDHYNPSPVIQQLQQGLREKLAEQKESSSISFSKAIAPKTLSSQGG